jgi:hypothetical protein
MIFDLVTICSCVARDVTAMHEVVFSLPRSVILILVPFHLKAIVDAANLKLAIFSMPFLMRDRLMILTLYALWICDLKYL